MANLTNASDEPPLAVLTQPTLAQPREHVRSTVQRIGSRTQPSDPSGRRTIVRSQRAFVATHSYRTKLWYLLSANDAHFAISAAPPAYRTAPPPRPRHPRSPPSPRRPAANPGCPRRYGVRYRRCWRCPDNLARHPRWYRPTDCRRWCCGQRAAPLGRALCGVGRGWRRAFHYVAIRRSNATQCFLAESRWAGSTGSRCRM